MYRTSYVLRGLVALYLFAVVVPGWACDVVRTGIFFVNGVNTPRQVAREQAKDLGDIVTQHLSDKASKALDASCLRFWSAYNSDEFGNESTLGIATDFFEAAAQLGVFDPFIYLLILPPCPLRR